MPFAGTLSIWAAEAASPGAGPGEGGSEELASGGFDRGFEVASPSLFVIPVGECPFDGKLGDPPLDKFEPLSSSLLEVWLLLEVTNEID